MFNTTPFLRHNKKNINVKSGFTIVELLVVIVVIGILVSITIVSYTGLTNKAVGVSLQSDLTNSSDQLKIYKAYNKSFPTSLDGDNCPLTPVKDTGYCFETSSNNTYTEYTSDGSTFSLVETNANGTTYGINDTSTPVALAQPTNCPTGFIPVPGSATYGQAGFCVMKYAASQVGATNVPTSVPSVQPWVNISQTTAIANSPNVVGCTGCHLITEPEYMTIAQNVLGVASNWSTGTVGSGWISSGHNDMAPYNALVPDPSDANGNAGETNQTFAQKRTLTLSNGQVIWDMAGNVLEWTSGTSTTGQPGVAGNAYASQIQWPSVTTHGTLSQDPFPGTTGITGSSAWTSTQGIGQLISNPAEAGLRGFLRGGDWGNGNGNAGVLALNLSSSPSGTLTNIGFRVSR